MTGTAAPAADVGQRSAGGLVLAGRQARGQRSGRDGSRPDQLRYEKTA